METYIYDAFGNMTALDETGAQITGDPKTRYLFTAQEYVAQIDHYQYDARWYDSFTGQFLSADPIEFDLQNSYRYVGNSPTNKVDPQGLQEIPSWLAQPDSASNQALALGLNATDTRLHRSAADGVPMNESEFNRWISADGPVVHSPSEEELARKVIEQLIRGDVKVAQVMVNRMVAERSDELVRKPRFVLFPGKEPRRIPFKTHPAVIEEYLSTPFVQVFSRDTHVIHSLKSLPDLLSGKEYKDTITFHSTFKDYLLTDEEYRENIRQQLGWTPMLRQMVGDPRDDSIIRDIEFALDGIGLAPVIGAPADVMAGTLAAARGDFVAAGLSFASTVIDGAALAKYGGKSLDFLKSLRRIDNVADATTDAQRVASNGSLQAWTDYTWIRNAARLAQRELDLSMFVQRARRMDVQVTLNSAKSEAFTYSIKLTRKVLRSEPLEEMIHVRQWRGVFDEPIRKIMKSYEFKAIAHTSQQDALRAAREIHAKQLLLNHNEVFQLGKFNRWILQQQVKRLWKHGVNKGY